MIQYKEEQDFEEDVVKIRSSASVQIFSCSAQITKGAKGGEPVAKGMRDDVDVEGLRGRKAERENKIRG